MECIATQFLLLLETSCKNIKIKNKDTAEYKIKNILLDGFKNLQVVADFDATLTKSIVNEKPAAHTLDVFANVTTLSDAYHKGAASLERKYTTKLYSAKDEEEKHELYVGWWKDHEAICVGEMAPISEIQKAVDVINTPLRDECEDMLELLALHGVPLTVVSAGIGEIIEYQLQKFKPNIVSNFINSDENNCILSFTQPLVSVYNKHKMTLPVYEQRYNVIVVGDSLGDCKMADGILNTKTILKIGFFIGEDQDKLGNYMNVYDIVIINDQTMAVLIKLLKLIESQHTNVCDAPT